MKLAVVAFSNYLGSLIKEETNMAITTKQQQRAAFALKSLDTYKTTGVPKDYAQFIVGMPNMILS